jgi:putative spermidine/putrescine transport system permease protein
VASVTLQRRGRSAAFAALAWLVLGFVVAPLLFVIYVSFFSNRIVSFPPEGYTLRWFTSAWSIAAFRDGFLLSIQVGLVATLGALLVGVPAAILIGRYRFPGREALLTLLMSPLIVPAIVAGTAVYLAFIRFEIGTDIQIAGTMPGLVGAHTVIAIPWTLRLVLASLLGADRSIEEAALNLGATPAIAFATVVLPVIKPGIVAGGLFAFVISFIDLEKSIFLVGPGRTTLPIAIVQYLEWNLDPTICAVATIQIGLIGALLLISDRFVKLSKAF